MIPHIHTLFDFITIPYKNQHQALNIKKILKPGQIKFREYWIALLQPMTVIFSYKLRNVTYNRTANCNHSQAGDADSSRHLVAPLDFRGPWMSTVVLYWWCHSDSASVLLYLTLNSEHWQWRIGPLVKNIFSASRFFLFSPFLRLFLLQ